MELNFNLTGSIVAIVTPFDENDKIDYIALDKLIDFHLENQTNGIVVSGTTGESPSFSAEEYTELVTFVVKKVNKRIPVIAGSGCNNTHKTVERSKKAEQCGADAILVVTPYYNKPMPAGYYQHFAEVAKNVNIPIIMYNVPGRTAKPMPIPVALKLTNDFKNIVAIKEASGDLMTIMELVARKPGNFKIYSGDDPLAMAAVLMGADGCISVAANVIPKEFSQLMQLSAQHKIEEAKILQYKYLNLMNLNFIESNPIPVKTFLFYMGYIKENFRLPMTKIENEQTRNILYYELKKLEII